MNRLTSFIVAAVGLTISQGVLSQSRGIIAEYIVTQSKALSDDNRIERTIVGQYARDTHGRSKLSFDNTIVFQDPIEGLSWHANTVTGVAYQRRVNAATWSGRDRELVGSSGPSPPQPELNSPPLQAYSSQFSQEEYSVVELGLRTLGGVEQRGRRWTYSIPAGAIHNVRPIEIESEMWTTEVGVLGATLPVMVSSNDTLNGVHTRELRNIRTTDFDGSFFRPGDEFRIEELVIDDAQ